MPRLLFISTSLPPVAESQTIRNVFLINGLLERGYRIHLIQPPSVNGDPTLEQMIEGPVERTITMAPAYDSLLAGMRGYFTNPALWSLVHRAIAKSAGMVCVPDLRADWQKKAYTAAIESHSSFEPDVIVSSSGSNAAHVAAARLARRWKIPWIAEFGDPWSLNPLRPASHFHIRTLNRILERRALRSASTIVFTTQETAKAFSSLGFSAGLRTEVIPCGFDTSILNRAERTREAHAPLIFAYVGTASKGSRDLSPVVEMLRDVLARNPALPNIRIRLIGSVDRSLGQSEPPDGRLQIFHCGWVSYGDSIRELAEADALILAGNRSDLQIPAKVYNYMASGKAILYLSQQPARNDPTWRLLTQYENCAIVSAEESGNSRAVDSLVRSLATDSVSTPKPRRDILSWNEVGHQFAAVVDAQSG